MTTEDQPSNPQTTNRPPFNIKPGERYTDKQTGKTWELTDHGQWKEIHDAQE